MYAYDYIDQRVVKRLAGSRLRFRRVMDGKETGLHGSTSRGYAMEFSQHREYVPGDDLRTVDWRVYARRERLYVKEYEEDSNFQAVLLVDVSASMDFTSGPPHTKLEYAKRLASHLAWFFLRQKDRVGLGFFAGGLVTLAAPESGPGTLRAVVEALRAAPAGGTTAIEPSLRAAFGAEKKRGLVVVISDFLEQAAGADSLARAFAPFRARRQPVLAVRVADPLERDLALDRIREFHDPESGARLVADPAAARGTYRAAYAAHAARVRALCHASGIGCVEAATDEPLERALGACVAALGREG